MGAAREGSGHDKRRPADAGSPPGYPAKLLPSAPSSGATAMQTRRVVFPAKGKVELETVDLPASGPGQVALETIVSIISPGTELAWLNAAPGTPGTFPQQTGYSSCA